MVGPRRIGFATVTLIFGGGAGWQRTQTDVSTVVRSNIDGSHPTGDDLPARRAALPAREPGEGQGNLLRIASKTGTGRLLDIGCGAGFVIDLLRDTFDEIHGIDATRAMLDRVDTSSGNVTLHEGVAEELPFEDGTFDLVTAYSVLHHLADHRPVLAEARRVLRPGGVLYVDLEPNRAFWRAIADVEDEYAARLGELDEIVAREVRAVLHVEDDLRERFGIAPETFRSAEYIKSHLGGFEPSEFERTRSPPAFARATRPTNGSSARLR